MLMHIQSRRLLTTAIVVLTSLGVSTAGTLSAQAAPTDSDPAATAPSGYGSPGQGPVTPVQTGTQSLSATASALAPAISRAEVISRAKSWVGRGLDYNQGAYYQGYRMDCSGYVSMAWNLSSSLTTDTFAGRGVTTTITKSQLRAGDALLDDDGGNSGHVVLFEKWTDSSKSSYMGLEFSSTGVHYREIPYPYFSGFGPYVPVRNKSITDTGGGAHDFTGDGRDDLASVGADGVLRVYGNEGVGKYDTVELGGGWSPMNKVAAADFNADGKGDLVAVNKDSGALFLYLGKGDGHFNAAVQIGQGWQNMSSVVAGDFTGDGKADIVAVDADSNLQLYSGTGTDVNHTKQIGQGWSGMTNLAAGDVNGDGRADIVAMNKTTGDIHLYKGDSSGVTSAGVIGTNFNAMNRLTVADINDDGKADVVTTHATSGDLYLYTSSGTDLTSAGIIGHGWNTIQNLI
ncbi:FG-GAP repeat protein [Streptomyces scabiei]|uniref:FG-GAP repeat protein n=3 Tax=Streptomyces scabiei TaxID=1930 RepID=A0A100JQE5_STRSC|nr:FG-GAP repeat protein [Streptomyces scabiei]